nr:AAA family ATPase [Bifidobacterium longum]
MDSSTSVGFLCINAMGEVNEMMIVIQAEYYAVEGIGQRINIFFFKQKTAYEI